jgi:hypothetical protein
MQWTLRQSRPETEHLPPYSAKNKDWVELCLHSAVILPWLVQVNHYCTGTTLLYRYNTTEQLQHYCTGTTLLYRHNTNLQAQHYCTGTTLLYRHNTTLQAQHYCTGTTLLYMYNTTVQASICTFSCPHPFPYDCDFLIHCISYFHHNYRRTLTEVFPTLTEVSPYPDWGFSLPWLRFLPNLTEDFLYPDWGFFFPDWGFSLPWLRFLPTLTEVSPYPHWGFSLPWLRFVSTLPEVFSTLTEVFLPWQVFSTLSEVFPTLTEVSPYTDWGFSLPWLKFLRAFSSVVRQIPGITHKDGARPTGWLPNCC